MLPGIGALTVIGHITYGIIGKGAVVDRCQLVAPGVGIAVIIQRARVCADGDEICGIGIFPAVFDIAAFAVDPGVGIAFGFVILTDKLVGFIVLVGSGICAVADRGYVAIAVIGIGELGDSRTVPCLCTLLNLF